MRLAAMAGISMPPRQHQLPMSWQVGEGHRQLVNRSTAYVPASEDSEQGDYSSRSNHNLKNSLQTLTLPLRMLAKQHDERSVVVARTTLSTVDRSLSSLSKPPLHLVASSESFKYQSDCSVSFFPREVRVLSNKEPPYRRDELTENFEPYKKDKEASGSTTHNKHLRTWQTLPLPDPSSWTPRACKH